MIKNLVIGSDGFIGTPFCKFLEDKGETVVRFDIKRSDKEDARIAALDFSDIDYVYFLAWEVGGAKYLYQENTQLTQLHWNLDLLNNVMKHIEKQKPKFMFASSQLSEEYTVYGATKRLGELWTDLLGGTTVRIWNAYGVMEKNDIKSHVISDFVYQAVSKGKITMLTDGEEWRQFTHIDDLSRAFYLAAHEKLLRRSVYDASSYEWIRIKDIAQIISNKTGAPLKFGTKKGNSPSAENSGRLPGWLPKISLERGLEQMITEAKALVANDKAN